MSRNENVDNSIWHDPDFDALSNAAQHFYLWSFTNPRCGMAGIYLCPRRQLLEGRLSDKNLDAVLAELADAQGLPVGSDGGRRGHVSGTFFHAIARKEID